MCECYICACKKRDRATAAIASAGCAPAQRDAPRSRCRRRRGGRQLAQWLCFYSCLRRCHILTKRLNKTTDGGRPCATIHFVHDAHGWSASYKFVFQYWLSGAFHLVQYCFGKGCHWLVNYDRGNCCGATIARFWTIWLSNYYVAMSPIMRICFYALAAPGLPTVAIMPIARGEFRLRAWRGGCWQGKIQISVRQVASAHKLAEMQMRGTIFGTLSF